MKLRWPAPQVGRRSSSSGRASVITYSGWFRDHSSRYSTKSRSDSSAHCMSSKASTVGYVVREPLEEQPPGGEQVLALAGVLATETEQLREARLDEPPLLRRRGGAPRASHRSFASAAAGSSSSAIRQRIRTMSASAQYVTPSP